MRAGRVAERLGRPYRASGGDLSRPQALMIGISLLNPYRPSVRTVL